MDYYYVCERMFLEIWRLSFEKIDFFDTFYDNADNIDFRGNAAGRHECILDDFGAYRFPK